MSTNSDNSIREVGSGNGPPRRAPGRLALTLVGVGAGLALGVLIATPETSSDETSEPPMPTTTVTPAAPRETTTTGTSSSAEAYEARIEDLEAALAKARQQVFDLGLEVDPTQYAVALGCEESIGPQYPSDWQPNSYFVGPVAFYRLTERLPAPGWDEVFAVVEASDSVTLVVPMSERSHYSLIWNPDTWVAAEGYTVADGEPAVTLAACDEVASVFIGGFVSDQTYCAPLDVYAGESTEPKRVELPFGGALCSHELSGFSTPEQGPVPDVTGLALRDARLAIRLVGMNPVVNDGEPQLPDSLVWAQEPNEGRTYSAGTNIGLRTCQAADHVVATYQQRLDSSPDQGQVMLSHGWMTRSSDPNLEAWYFVSALVSGSHADGQIATWALPGFNGVDVHVVNTPNLSVPANDVSQQFGFGFSPPGFEPENYGVSDWLDLDGAVASQRCVSASNAK